jgi:O-antigen ligase
VGVAYVFRSQKKLQSVVVVMTLAGVVGVVLPHEFWERMSSIPISEESIETVAEGPDEGGDTSAASRIHFWRVATNMAFDNPLFGVGVMMFPRFYNLYDFSQGLYGRGRSVHSLWFGILAEVGIPAFLIFVLLLGLTLGGCGAIARRARRGELPLEFYHYAVALQIGFVACMVGASFLPFQYTEMMWHCFGLSIALRFISMNPASATAAEPAPAVVEQPATPFPGGYQPVRPTWHA